MPSNSVIVIGGGLAGLSSGVALAEAGFRVRLLEKRPHLGGRATSYLLPSGEHVDNCQHVTLGCCTNLDDFYRRVGAAHKIRTYCRLLFADSVGRRGVIEASSLAPPFHLAPSFAFFPSLTWADKHSIGHALLRIARSGGRPTELDGTGGATMLDWLRRLGQTEAAIERFWRVVLVSALDEELGRTDARYGVNVFWKAFLANRSGFELGIPAVPLGELYDGCRGAIELRGGEVRTRVGVREICIAEGRVTGVRLENDEEATADFYVAAVPHDLLLTLLPAPVVEREPVFANLRNLRTSPITGVHLWFDRSVMNEPFLTLLDRTTQWIFNKSRLYAASDSAGTNGGPAEAGQYLQLVISASYDLVPRSRQEIIELCRRELQEVLPGAREAQLLKATVIKETAATFSPEPGCDRWRPAQNSPVKNLFLAGDWTATGWPATMEGAVRSGYLAAEGVLTAAGQTRKLLRPDLPAEGLARCWAHE
ncbi:MAG: hydroxysqualene dehydroxylase HpnE [Candidatus Acidiferrales bacterium]